MILFAPDPATLPLVGCSPSSWIVQIVLEEKRAAYETRWLGRGAEDTPELRALSPRGILPILQDGDAAVFQPLAIIDYLEWRCPDPPLLPAEPVARAVALTRLHESAILKRAAKALLAHLIHHPQRVASHPRVKHLLDRLIPELRRWEGYEEETWFAGDQFTLADVVVFPFLAVLVRLGFDLPEALDGWLERARQRPAIQATWPAAWKAEPRFRPLYGASIEPSDPS